MVFPRDFNFILKPTFGIGKHLQSEYNINDNNNINIIIKFNIIIIINIIVVTSKPLVTEEFGKIFFPTIDI